ncbi:MAG: ZIP family metal transporter [Flavobacteriales bacterium]|nr:ZIP family metal transporter [Flavobacteriales bacterium]
MNELVQYSILLCGTALLGGLIIQIAGSKLLKHLKLLLSFGGAYLIGLCFLHLVPEVFATGGKTAGWFVLGGFLLQLLLEYLSQGIEHGHFHEPKAIEKGKKQFPLMIFISLCIHAFIEAMPLTGGMHDHGHDHSHVHLDGDSLLIGIIIHKLPVAMVLAGMLLSAGLKSGIRWGLLLVFGLMPVAGLLLSDLLLHHSGVDMNMLITGLSGVLIGILLHISTTILFETSDGHHFNLTKLLVVIAGILMAALTL